MKTLMKIFISIDLLFFMFKIVSVLTILVGGEQSGRRTKRSRI